MEKYATVDDTPNTLQEKLYVLLTKVRNKQLRDDDYFNNKELEGLSKQFIAQEIDGIDCGVDWTKLY